MCIWINNEQHVDLSKFNKKKIENQSSDRKGFDRTVVFIGIHKAYHTQTRPKVEFSTVILIETVIIIVIKVSLLHSVEYFTLNF